jgi:hypothetical protein
LKCDNGIVMKANKYLLFLMLLFISEQNGSKDRNADLSWQFLFFKG